MADRIQRDRARVQGGEAVHPANTLACPSFPSPRYTPPRTPCVPPLPITQLDSLYNCCMEYALEHSGRIEALRGCPGCLDSEPFKTLHKWGRGPTPSSFAAATASSAWALGGGTLYSIGGGGGAGRRRHAASPHGPPQNPAMRQGCAAASPPHICSVCSGLLSHATCLRLLRGATRRLHGYRGLWEGVSGALLAEGLQYDAAQGQVRIRDFSRWSRLSHPSAAVSAGNPVRRSMTEPGEGCNPV